MNNLISFFILLFTYLLLIIYCLLFIVHLRNIVMNFKFIKSHDYHQRPDAQIEYYKLRQDDRWIMPSHYYHTELYFPRSLSNASEGNVSVLIVYIDTSILSPNSYSHTRQGGVNEVSPSKTQEQLAYIENTLSSSSADWKFVMGHFTSTITYFFHCNT